MFLRLLSIFVLSIITVTTHAGIIYETATRVKYESEFSIWTADMIADHNNTKVGEILFEFDKSYLFHDDPNINTISSNPDNFGITDKDTGKLSVHEQGPINQATSQVRILGEYADDGPTSVQIQSKELVGLSDPFGIIMAVNRILDLNGSSWRFWEQNSSDPNDNEVLGTFQNFQQRSSGYRISVDSPGVSSLLILSLGIIFFFRNNKRFSWLRR